MADRKLLVRMPEDMHDALGDISLLTGVSLNQLVIQGISKLLGQEHHQQVREIVDDARTRYADVLEQLKDR